MSAMLESLLLASGDPERLADIARNDAIAGFPPAPPVELDELFFVRADLAMLGYKQTDGYGRPYELLLEQQQQRIGAVL